MKQINDILKCNNITLKNRIVMPPMATASCDENGYVSDKLLQYYNDKTFGGYFSLVIIEHSFVSNEGKAQPKQMSVASDSHIEGLSKLAHIIHSNGSKAVMQISHAGASAIVDGTFDKIAPSVFRLNNRTYSEAEMTQADIADTVQKFAVAAKRAVEAGFDGIEIHSAHGYLLNQFYSPLTNHRTDEYGGNVENRIRIHLEIIQAIQSILGTGIPILLRLGALDYQECGNQLEDALQAAKLFEKAGVSILDISGGMNGYIVPNPLQKQGYYTDVTSKLKEIVNIPIIMTGGITNIDVAQNIIQNGQADLVGIGRAVLKDSDWIKKAAKKVGL